MIGILGESMELAAQWLAKYKHIGPYRWVLPLETFFGITLCAGLAMGFLGSHRAKQIAGGQTTTLQQAVRQAEQAAAQANERAAANELTAKRLELQSVSIRKQLLDLQARASGRTISVEQETNLINRLKPFTQTNALQQARFMVDFDGQNPECLHYAKRMADVLFACGFKVQSVPSLRLASKTGIGLLFEVRDGLNPPAHAREITKAFSELNLPVIVIGNTSVAPGVLHILIMARSDG